MNFVKELKVDDKFLLGLIKIVSNLNISSFENFENFLKNNFNIKNIKEKFYIEIIWNNLIFKNLEESKY